MAGNNTNIMHVEAIEGLAMQIGEQLALIEPESAEQMETKAEAMEFLHLYQENQVLDLRTAFE